MTVTAASYPARCRHAHRRRATGSADRLASAAAFGLSGSLASTLLGPAGRRPQWWRLGSAARSWSC